MSRGDHGGSNTRGRRGAAIRDSMLEAGFAEAERRRRDDQKEACDIKRIDEIRRQTRKQAQPPLSGTAQATRFQDWASRRAIPRSRAPSAGSGADNAQTARSLSICAAESATSGFPAGWDSRSAARCCASMAPPPKQEKDHTMVRTILVIGGTGMLGEPVARRLAADGWRVRILTRRPEQARRRFADPFDIVQGDVEDETALERALLGCNAAHLSLQGEGDWDLERRGAERLSTAAAKLGLSRITMISGASACEENAWFPMIRAKLSAERAVHDSGVPFTIFRCTMFMELLPSFVQGSKAIVMGEQPYKWHWTAARDYARMVAAALARTEAEGKTFYVYGPEALTLREAVEQYRLACAPHARLATVPFWILSLVALLPSKRKLRQVGLPIMRYFSKVAEIGDPSEANAILGAPTTTLTEWCRT
jgi:uncharacterized protein YbjT (DUF2867 family)